MHALPELLARRTATVLAFMSLVAACSDRTTTAPTAPPTTSAAELVPGVALREELQPIYPVDVAIVLSPGANQIPLAGRFPALYGSVMPDRGIAFVPSQSPDLGVSGGAVLTFVDGVVRGQGMVVITVGQQRLVIDFAQFSGRRVDPFAGGIPGGGCIFARAISDGGNPIAVRLDFAPLRG